MSKTNNRFTERVRHSNPHLEFLPAENSGRSKRGLSLQPPILINRATIHLFRKNQLIEAIARIEKENENIRRENLLFSRYLRRVNGSKIVETFDEYEDESDVTLIEEGINSNQTSIYVKLPEIARRSFVKKSSNSSSKGISLWSKLSVHWREHIYAPFLLRVEQEKLSIAAYEIEQTKLDSERMKTNAHLALDDLDVLLRTVESDESAEEKLNYDLEKNVYKFRINRGDIELHNPRLIAPAELVISRINKRINSQVNLIGLLHMNNARIHLRIRGINAAINDLDDLRDKLDEIDLNFVRTRKIDYSDTYVKLDRKYKLEKSSQYPLLCLLHQWKKDLSEQEEEKIDLEQKYELTKYRFDKINNEIDCIKHENKSISNETNCLRDRIAYVKEVPTIMDYAHIIEQTKKLQHNIDIWTKRVNIAETLLSQLKWQTKSPSVLPSLKPTVTHQRQSFPLPDE